MDPLLVGYEREKYELVTSEAVIAELSRGDYPSKDQTLALVEPLPLLDVEDPIGDGSFFD
jgi:hypothetical protein